MPLLPDVLHLLDFAASNPRPAVRDLSPEQARSMVDSLGGVLDLPADGSVTARDLAFAGPEGEIDVRLYSPDQNCAGPVVLYLHGGGWVVGSLASHDSFCRHLAEHLQCRVVSVDYRLAPEHPFPAAYDDCAAALAWVTSSPAKLGLPVQQVAIAGDSAGGGLAASLALRPTGPALCAVLLLYPVTDLSRRAASYESFASGYLLEADDMAYFIAAYVPDNALRGDPRVSPLLAQDLSHLPACVVLTCGADVLRDEGRAFAARLAEQGVTHTFIEAPGHVHGIATLRAALPSAVPVLDRCIDEFGRLLSAAG